MIDNTKFGENTLYVQKMFSTVDTRNFGRMGENVAKAARIVIKSIKSIHKNCILYIFLIPLCLI